MQEWLTFEGSSKDQTYTHCVPIFYVYRCSVSTKRTVAFPHTFKETRVKYNKNNNYGAYSLNRFCFQTIPMQVLAVTNQESKFECPKFACFLYLVAWCSSSFNYDATSQ